MEHLTNAEIEILLNQMEEMIHNLPNFENDEFLQHLTEFEDCYLKVYRLYEEIDESYCDRLFALGKQKDDIFDKKFEALNKLISGTPNSELTVDNPEEWLKEQKRSFELMKLQSRFAHSRIDFAKRSLDRPKRDYVIVDHDVYAAQMKEILENPEEYTEEEIQNAIEFLEWYENRGEKTQEDDGLFRKRK